MRSNRTMNSEWLKGLEICMLALTFPSVVLAQSDNTGTNPANFTYDFRLITEMAQIDGGGGSLRTYIAEYRWPLGRDLANLRGEESGSLFYDMGSKFGMRFRAR